MSWASRYVGTPWALHGRDWSGCDCWGLACLVHREELGVELPPYLGYASADEHADISALIAGATATPTWHPVEGGAQPFDVLVFRRGRLQTHVGIAVAPGTMLHMVDEDCAKVERFDVGAWRHRLSGVWRHAERCAPRKQVPVLAMPLLGPDEARVRTELPHGLTVAEMVAAVLPAGGARDNIRVSLVTARGAELISPQIWDRVRPHPGVQVIVRVVPGKSALRSVLAIAITVAAVALGAYFAPGLAGTLGLSQAAWQGVITAGVSALGNLALNALVPPNTPDDPKPNYTLSGWRNRLDPDGAVPVVLGTHRYAPPFAATSYTEIVGDWQYVRALFTFGYGPLSITDVRIGETSVTEYDEVELELRDGRSGDAPVSLYPRQVIEEPIGTELTRPMPRDDAGNIIDDDASIETPVVRTTADDTDTASIILAWPSGLIYINDKGKKRTEQVQIRIERRLVTASSWEPVRTITVRAKKDEPFYRQYTLRLPSRGRWQLRLTMMTEEPADMGRQRRTVWVALQSIRPEYPLAFDAPLSLLSMRIKATHQLNGSLDDVSAVVSRICPDYDQASGSWVSRATSNPASLFRWVLQSPALAKPVADSGIDLDQLTSWHEFCRVNDLRYDRVIDQAGASLRDVLTEIAAAGRATPSHDGLRWGVIVDRSQSLVVDHISPRNSRNFRASRNYFEPPHAFRVKFNDAENDWKPAERTVLWPGHTGPVTVVEALDLPGKTRAHEVWVEARRRQYEALHRCDTYEVIQDGPVRVATRGDLVMLSHDVLDEVQCAARVVSVIGREVELDEELTIEPATTYAIRFRTGLSAQDTVGQSVVRSVVALTGPTRILALPGEGPLPVAGDVVVFGRSGTETLPVIVTAVEAAEDMACLIRMTNAAEEIRERLAADYPPVWSARVGAEVPASLVAPPEPRLRGITSGVVGTGTRDLVEVEVRPGTGSVATEAIRVRHRKSGASAWTILTIDASEGSVQINGYVTGDQIEVSLVGVSPDQVESAPTTPVAHRVGQLDAPLAQSLDEADVTVTPLPGGIRVDFKSGDSTATTAVQLYRSSTATLNRATDLVNDPVPVSPSRRYTAVVGDGTRDNLIASNADMAAAGGWTLGTGWSVSGGTANHAAGSQSAVSRTIGLKAGRWYRIGYRVAAISGGAVTASLSGGSSVNGSARSAAGTFRDRLQALSGNTQIAWTAAAAAVCSIDDVVVFEETSACLAPGTHFIWLEPLNADGIAGSVIGPFSVDLI